MSLSIPTDDANAIADVASGVYEKFRRLVPGDRVLDIGAHVGAFTEMASHKVGACGLVVAFEPHPRNFFQLQERCRGLRNVITMNAAAWSSDGHASLWNNPGNSGGHSIFRCGQHDECLTVVTVDILKWMINAGFRPDFVKMDCEGSEYEILSRIFQSAHLKRIPEHIAFEAHSGELYHKCADLLRSCRMSISPDTETVGVCYSSNLK